MGRQVGVRLQVKYFYYFLSDERLQPPFQQSEHAVVILLVEFELLDSF